MSLKETAKSLASRFNFNVSVNLNGKSFTVPVIKNMGFTNRSLKQDWLWVFFKSFKMPENGAFIDVGVNVGQTLLKYKSCHSNPYIGFEPNANCVYYTTQLIQANDFRNVNILPVGLSVKNDIAKFYKKHDADAAGTTFSDLRPGFYDASSVTYVPVFAFDELQLDGTDKIALIKIDVEGGELEVFQGMQQSIAKHKPAIICEILDSHNDENIPSMQKRADALIAIMHNLQYDIYHIVPNGDTINVEKIDAVVIKKWTPASWDENDYLFLPKGTSYADITK